MRIVSLLPSSTEIVYALGLGDALVGVTHECDYPPDAQTKAILTRSRVLAQARPGETRAAAIDREVNAHLHDGISVYDIDAQRLAELAPDLILTQELCAICAVSTSLLQATLDAIGLHPQVLSLQPTALDDVWTSILDVGRATETRARAETVVARYRAEIDDIRARTHDRAHPRTLVLEWTDPPMGSGHWTPALVEIAGGEPVLGWSGEYSRVIDWSEIVAADPQCVIVAPCGMDIPATRAALAELDASCEPWRRLLASGLRVVALDGHHFVNRPGPRLVETARLFAAAVHPGAYDTHDLPSDALEIVQAGTIDDRVAARRF